MITVTEAQSLITNQAKNFGSEEIALSSAQGRVLAEDIFADRDYPPFHRAAMDGYALRSEDFLNGLREFIVVEEIYAGALAVKKIGKGECYKIMTGASTPVEADAVIRVEDTIQQKDKVIFQTDQLKKGQNIAQKGEDRKAGELVLKKNTLLKAPEAAALAVLGKTKISVYKLPEVSIISTGDEVIAADQPVLTHQIRDSNSYAVEGFLKNYHIPLSGRKLVKDDKDALTKAVNEFIGSDILVLSGGVSMGDADYVPEVLKNAGVEKIFHKVALKPGKPLWFGKSKNGVVFALPGNPMSVQISFKLFIEPFLRTCFGLPPMLELKLPITTLRKKKVKFDEYFPCVIENGSVLKPVTFNGSGDVTSILYSDGLAVQEAEKEELKEGDLVKFWFW